MTKLREMIESMPEGEMKELLTHFLDQHILQGKRIDKLERAKISLGKSLTDDQFIAYLKQQFDNMDIDAELRKMEAWTKANNRQMTRKFITNWLIRNKPVNGNGKDNKPTWMK